MPASRLPFSSLRSVRIAIVTLLGVCVAQAAYWTIEQSHYADRIHAERLAQYSLDVRAAIELVQRGARESDVLSIYPDLVYEDHTPVLSAAARAAIDEARSSRLIRYGAEGAFFLLVLIGAIWVLARALRQDAAVRRRQQSFLASASHEFKSPLASARLSIETLALRDPSAETRTRLFDRALEDLARLEGLVVNLLDNAQLEEGGVRLVRERIDLARAAAQAQQEIADRARAHGVRVAVAAPAEVECEADPVAVRSILRNLLDNALKAVVPGDGGRIELSIEPRGAFAVVSVSDNGIGFESAACERLFEKFHRELRPDAPARGGSGLGLYLVRRFAELQGGFARAHSDGPGRGARFEVAWPLYRAHVADLSAEVAS
jgi:signal transduction histidine kinase